MTQTLRGKVSSSRADHARTLGFSIGELELFGWDLDVMAEDIAHAWRCPYCRRTFGEIGADPRHRTFEIIDPRRSPYYRTNVRVVCSACNTAKARKDPDAWEAYLARRYREREATALVLGL